MCTLVKDNNELYDVFIVKYREQSRTEHNIYELKLR